MADNIPAWDAPGVVARAKALILSSNYVNVEDARKEVEDTLSKWVVSVQAQSDAQRVARGSSAIVALWRQYAALEMELRQFKQATKVFERAVNCPVAGSNLALWLQYADFCVERKRFSNARKVFVRALEALPKQEHTAIWARFFGFVCTHVDGTLSLAMLQHQVMPDQFPKPGTLAMALSSPCAHPPPSVVPSSVASPLPSTSLSTTLQSQPQANMSTSKVVADVDPAVAFIDTTGDVTPSLSPLAVECVGLASRKSLESGLASNAKRGKPTSASPVTAYFAHVPLTLPFIPSCPHLLFDSVADGAAQKQLGNELLERLSDVLGDSAVFEGVRDLCHNQRTRDRAMLYRWQELVGMQMKEGSDLFARHVALEMQLGFADPRGLIELKTQHLGHRREFSSRCQMSQQQFIEICAVDRASFLKAQQISLENMKIPEITVTTEVEAVNLQRGIVGLILEAEQLYREDSQSRASAPSKKSQALACAPPGRRQRRDSQDSTTSNRSAARSSSGTRLRGSGNSRPDARSARNAGNNSTSRRRDRDVRVGRGRSNKWDIHPPPSHAPSTALASPIHAHYECAGGEPHMPQYDRGPHQPRHFPQQRPYGALPYGDRQGAMTEPQAYALQPAGSYFPDSLHPRGESDRLVGQGGPSRGNAEWVQQQPQHFHPQPQPLRPHTGPLVGEDDFRPAYDPSLARYGAATGNGSGTALRDGPDPALYGDARRSAVPAAALYYHEPPPQQASYRPPHEPLSQPAPLRHENYATYPFDQFGLAHGDFQQRGDRLIGTYGPPQDMMARHPPLHRFQQDQLLPSPAPAGMNTTRRNRRGGGRHRR